MLGFDGAESLAEALKVNSRLTTLQLEGNGIDSDGAIAIADALKVNTSLTDVNLKENGLGNSGVDAISEALLVNSTLNCLGTLIIPQLSSAPLSSATYLTREWRLRPPPPLPIRSLLERYFVRRDHPGRIPEVQ